MESNPSIILESMQGFASVQDFLQARFGRTIKRNLGFGHSTILLSKKYPCSFSLM